ncbi:LysR family transcriptional regulator [Streptomyces sp. NBC_01262]|uniref:LysR family transcriptional regulator n=1 Tax=Streptomyces sp. NBC_01262 TaxID=2903803 RepID=UPI002E313B41|nr:LysR family transcriptional regulator [Streptomyces sp. NBC_01262]
MGSEYNRYRLSRMVMDGSFMELRQIRAFVVVADEASFTRAAARLNVVQSAVSAAVRNLERQVGFQLLERTTHHVKLTQAGRLFLPEARRTLAAAQEAQHVLEQLRGGLRGEVRLGLIQTPQHVVVNPAGLIANFRASHPGVTVSVQFAGSVQHAEDLRRRRLDIAFVALAPEATAGLELYVLKSEKMQLLCRNDRPMSGRDHVELAELVDEPFIETPVTWGNRLATDAAFARAGLSRRIAYEIGDVPSFVSLVKHGLGVAIVPMSFIDLQDEIRAVPLGADAPGRALSLAVPAGHLVSAPAMALLQVARDMHESRT